MRWFAVSAPDGATVPEWVRSACLADDGRVFAPAIVAGDEMRVLLCAAHDGVSLILDDGHAYLPTDWLAREYPEVADVCARIESRLRDASPPASPTGP
jgi:hypothetical protein